LKSFAAKDAKDAKENSKQDLRISQNEI